MRTPRVLALGMTMLVLLGACTTGGGATPRRVAAPSRSGQAAPSAAASAAGSAAAKAEIRIGSDNFYESKLMARDLRPGPRERRATRSSASSASARARSGSRRWTPARSTWSPEYVGSGLGFYDKTKITGDGQANADALQAVDQAARACTVLGDLARARTRTRSSSARTPRLAQPHEDERPRRGPGPAQVGPPVRLRHEPALRGRAQGLRDHLPAEAAHGARRVRRRRWPRRSRARRSTSPSSARPSRPSPSSASSSSTTTSTPSRPRTSPRSSGTTTWPRSTRPPSRRSSTRLGQDHDRGADQDGRRGRGQQEGRRRRRQGVPHRSGPHPLTSPTAERSRSPSGPPDGLRR